ncbi:MAG: hypothetical protein ACE5IR_10365 [bacterium]
MQCHDYTGWKPVDKFPHKRAKFRLIGKHQNVACEKCHPKVRTTNGKFRKLGKPSFTKFVGLQFENCTPCHQDAHMSRLGQDCKKCHDPLGWHRMISDDFDHALTRFPLLGLHKKVSCEKCHIGGKTGNNVRFANCSDCHKDEHLGQYAKRTAGGGCESCHDVFGFVPAIYDVKEHQKSAYPLTGAHLAVPCVSCHVIAERGPLKGKRIFEFANTACTVCHVDVHKEQFATQVQLGGCESCHQTSTWARTSFDHNKSQFRLAGKHEKVACRKCHKIVDVGMPRERILFRPMKMACGDCHKDIHVGQFDPKSCDQCHKVIGWSELNFDHNTDSEFELREGHEKVECAKCHKLIAKNAIEFVLYKPLDKKCASCHG